jgi:hypothetical protein
MSALTEALIADLAQATDEQRAELAAILAPHLPSEPTQAVSDRWLRGAEQIAAYIAAPRSRVKALSSAGRIPVHHDGSALIARTSELDAWLRDGGGRRP